MDGLFVGLELELEAIFELLLVHVDDKIVEVILIGLNPHCHVSLFFCPVIPAHLIFSGIPGGVPSATRHLDINSVVNKAFALRCELIKTFDLAWDQGANIVLLSSIFLELVSAILSEGSFWIHREVGLPITKETW
jgi:hypothetical protein